MGRDIHKKITQSDKYMMISMKNAATKFLLN